MRRTLRRILHTTLLAIALPVLAPSAPSAQSAGDLTGADIVARICIACHKVGVMGAPKMGDDLDWEPRIAKGRGVLVKHAIEGVGQMPPRGGDLSLSDADVARAVDHMLSSVAAQDPQEGSGSRNLAGAAGTGGSPAEEKEVTRTADPVAADIAKRKSLARVNSFNRLMKPPSEWNPPPTEDGIHDPESRGTQMLLPPREAFDSLPKSKSGNRVDWVAALESGKIEPRYNRTDVDRKAAVLDFNVVREVKGSMPDVVYPHKQHTEWLDCVTCHPSIFIPAKGANAISMASILMGKQCGVCHGKVAFPVSECRKCHSKDKVTK